MREHLDGQKAAVRVNNGLVLHEAVRKGAGLGVLPCFAGDSDPGLAGTRVFAGPTVWIRMAHRLEPMLKKRKDQAVALLKRGFTGSKAERRSS